MTFLCPIKKLKISFLPCTVNLTNDLDKKHQNFDPVIRQLKSYKTNTNTKLKTKADITILGNKTLPRYFQKLNNTTIDENTAILEHQNPYNTVPCLPLNSILIAFHTSHSLNTKDLQEQKKAYLHTEFLFPKCNNMD